MARSNATRIVVHEVPPPEPYEIPRMLDAMRQVIAATDKLNVAQSRVAEAREALATAERQRDALTQAVVAGNHVGPSELRDAEAGIRDAEAYVLLLARGVEAAQVGLKTANSLVSNARSAEHSKRIDAAGAHKLAAIEALGVAQQAVNAAHQAEHVVRHTGIPADEISYHWGLLGYA